MVNEWLMLPPKPVCAGCHYLQCDGSGNDSHKIQGFLRFAVFLVPLTVSVKDGKTPLPPPRRTWQTATGGKATAYVVVFPEISGTVK
jgi:hypothetical protein